MNNNYEQLTKTERTGCVTTYEAVKTISWICICEFPSQEITCENCGTKKSRYSLTLKHKIKTLKYAHKLYENVYQIL